jgi:hypothetical protein
LAGHTPLKYVFSGKSLIAPEPEVGKFRNWAEMKVNDPTNKKNTHKDFSGSFRNIENFVQVEHLKKNLKNRLFFHFPAPGKQPVVGKFFQVAKINSYKCQIIR